MNDIMSPKAKKQKTYAASPSSLIDYNDTATSTSSISTTTITSEQHKEPATATLFAPCSFHGDNVMASQQPNESAVSYRESVLTLNDIGTRLFSLGQHREATIMYDTAIHILECSKNKILPNPNPPLDLFAPSHSSVNNYNNVVFNSSISSGLINSSNIAAAVAAAATTSSSTSTMTTAVSPAVIQQSITLGRHWLEEVTNKINNKNNNDSGDGDGDGDGAESSATTTTTTTTMMRETAFEEHPLDTYLDGSDVGPRPFRTPMSPLFMTSPSSTFIEIDDDNTIEAIVLFNRALVHHSKSILDLAIAMYEKALCKLTTATTTTAVAVAASSLPPSSSSNSSSSSLIIDEYKTQLEMFLRNNIGQIHYVEGNFDKAMIHFAEAFKCSEQHFMLNNKNNNKSGNINENSMNETLHNDTSAATTIEQRTKHGYKLTIATILSNYCRIQWMTMNYNSNQNNTNLTMKKSTVSDDDKNKDDQNDDNDTDDDDGIYCAFEQILKLRLAVLSWNHVDVASAHFNLGILAFARGKHPTSLTHFKEYMKIRSSLRNNKIKTNKNKRKRKQKNSATTNQVAATSSPLSPPRRQEQHQEEEQEQRNRDGNNTPSSPNTRSSSLNSRTSTDVSSSSSEGNDDVQSSLSENRCANNSSSANACTSSPSYCTSMMMTASSMSSTNSNTKLESIPALVYILLILNENEHDELSVQLKKCLHLLLGKRQTLGTVHVEVATLLNYCGALLFQKRQFPYAIEFYKEELRVEQNIISVQTLAKQSLANSTGTALSETAAINSNFNVMGSPLSLAVTFNNIGRVLQECGRYRRALQFYNRALKTKPNTIGDVYGSKKNATTSSIAINGGYIATAGGDSATNNISGTAANGSSESTATSAITTTASIMACRPGPSEVNLFATIWYNLGLIHDLLDSSADAIEAFENSLRLRKLILGPNHPDVSCLWYNIGTLQMESNMLMEASASLHEALRIRKLGIPCTQSDKHVINSLLKLASLHKKCGNINESIKAYESVLYLLQEATDVNNSVATASATSGNSSSSASGGDDATITPMNNKYQTGKTLHSLSELHHINGDINSALKVAQESIVAFSICVQQAKEELDNSSSSSSSCRCRLSNTYLNVIEQRAKVYLYLGSLFHECCDPILANAAYQNAKGTIENIQTSLLNDDDNENHDGNNDDYVDFSTARHHNYPSLSPLLEISQLLISSHCAPKA